MNHVIRAGVDINIVKRWLPIFELIVLILAIFSIASIKSIEKYARERTKSSLIKSNLKQVESLLQILQVEKHEFNRHIQTLQAMIYLNKNEEAMEYIEGISESHWNSDIIEFPDQPIIAGLLNSKYNLARSHGVGFAVSSACDFTNLAVEPWDLVSILGNIIDNAIEAALQDQEPRVGVEFVHVGSNYTIIVHNNGSTINKDDKEKIFEAGFTTKGSLGRGYGLLIARTLANFYEGEIDCRCGKNTTFRVILPDREVI